jgi:hypothetical protein
MSVVDIARKYIGSPYVFGANGDKPGQPMDCSRFVQNVMREMGVTISRSTSTQRNEGQAVNYDNMQPGDCIYYDGHVVMFIGNGNIIHASPNGVVERNIYDTKNIITIRRFLPDCISSSTKIRISFILDLDLYNALHPDLQKAFGGNHGALENHLHTYGLKEGRIFGYVFDPRFYSDKYGDIKNTFGDDFVAVTKHYLDFGINEGRQGIIIFDVSYYKNAYGDLRNAFGENKIEYVKHFLRYGLNEGRRASNEFDPIYYKNKYSDLQNAFGDHMKSYYQHYLQFGRFEGRQAHD